MQTQPRTSDKLPLVLARLFLDMSILFVAVQSIIASFNYLSRYFTRRNKNASV